MNDLDITQGISTGNKLLYVGVPRTGSQSFSEMLGAGGKKGYTSGNWAIQDFVNSYGDDLVNEYTIVSSIRNPYDRLYSIWKYAFRSLTFDSYVSLLRDNSSKIKAYDEKQMVIINSVVEDLPACGLLSMYNYMKHPKHDVDIILSIDNMAESIEKIENLVGNCWSSPVDRNKTVSDSKLSLKLKSRVDFVNLVNDIYSRDFAEFNYTMK